MEKTQEIKKAPEVKKVQEIKDLVRIANTDMNGAKNIVYALNNVKGVGIMLAHAIVKMSGISMTKKAGELTEQELNKIESAIKDPMSIGIPAWMVNRRKDPETGKDIHMTTADLTYSVENDIKMMKKIKSYKGVRHTLGGPVRGQKTRSNFRKNKGKVLGVRRAPAAKAAAPKTAEKK